ncbi:MAG: hypothetical protein ACJA01_002799 [Saprospiraceae bacterium]|jgi:hypothetical protein
MQQLAVVIRIGAAYLLLAMAKSIKSSLMQYEVFDKCFAEINSLILFKKKTENPHN